MDWANIRLSDQVNNSTSWGAGRGKINTDWVVGKMVVSTNYASWLASETGITAVKCYVNYFFTFCLPFSLAYISTLVIPSVLSFRWTNHWIAINIDDGNLCYLCEQSTRMHAEGWTLLGISHLFVQVHSPSFSTLFCAWETPLHKRHP